MNTILKANNHTNESRFSCVTYASKSINAGQWKAEANGGRDLVVALQRTGGRDQRRMSEADQHQGSILVKIRFALVDFVFDSVPDLLQAARHSHAVLVWYVDRDHLAE